MAYANLEKEYYFIKRLSDSNNVANVIELGVQSSLDGKEQFWILVMDLLGPNLGTNFHEKISAID